MDYSAGVFAASSAAPASSAASASSAALASSAAAASSAALASSAAVASSAALASSSALVSSASVVSSVSTASVVSSVSSASVAAVVVSSLVSLSSSPQLKAITTHIINAITRANTPKDFFIISPFPFIHSGLFCGINMYYRTIICVGQLFFFVTSFLFGDSIIILQNDICLTLMCVLSENSLKICYWCNLLIQ